MSTDHKRLRRVLRCGECERLIRTVVEVDRRAGVAAYTCPLCERTQEPSADGGGL